MRLQDRIALVTGGGQGIGAAICKRFAEEGATVIVADMNSDSGSATAREITAIGGKGRFQLLDVSAESAWDAAFAMLRRDFGRLDILVNNAAVDIANNIESMSLDEWRKTLAVNLDGVMFGMKRAIALMKENGRGSIVNISSIASMVGSPSTTAYSASKAAVVGLSRTAALHCAAQRNGIRINSVHPGPIRTPMVMKYATENPQFLAGMQAAIPLGTMGDPVDIANGALYLACDESKWVTGISLVIDGGYTAM
jgi:3(or 17)beta-hydroxysteroid dehydrogenase